MVDDARLRRSRTLLGMAAGLLIVVAVAVTLGWPGTAATARAVGSSAVTLLGARPARAETVRGADAAPPAAATAATTPTPANGPGPAVAVPTPVPPAPPVVTAGPSIAALVAEVEGAGVDPGTNWSWSVGDASARCGAIASAGQATGCTSWAHGVETTVFTGSPSLALVAHELANAEAAHDAVPSLVSQVVAAEAGTSWSPTDAVATCLVEHFLGLEDDAAGAWRCPAALATFVADHIHDTITVTTMTAVCGAVTGIGSTLTFTASAGTLAVTTPSHGSAPLGAAANTPVTVTGVGTFTAVDQGGTVHETGACQA
jgi:hypothetical protein